MTQKITLIQGPPGTGKTTVLSYIVYAWNKSWPNEKIMVCAPSNQAVQVCAENLIKINHLRFKVLFIMSSRR